MSTNSLTVAIYIRLSKDDDIDQESNSIKNQRLLIKNYLANHKELQNHAVVEYCDDGYSGTNFERPGVTELFKNVNENKIDCIVVKDFSRFGRNYLEVGNYLEQILPNIGVRFISINDNFDSKDNVGCTIGMEMVVKNLIYDYYSKDLSQKVIAVLKKKKESGKYLGGSVPYGYQRSPIEKGKIIIDVEVADIVRKIFEWTNEGYSRSDIARILNENEISTPVVHIMKSKKSQNLWNPDEKKYYWTVDAVIRILKNQVYLGKITNGKYRMKEVGSKHAILLPKEEWVTIENTHEAIISRELFNIAQDTFRYKKKASNRNMQENMQEKMQENMQEEMQEKIIDKNDRFEGEHGILFGKLRCGYCKYKMDLVKGKKAYYKCISPRFIMNARCSNEHAVVGELEDIILLLFSSLTKLLISNVNMWEINLQRRYIVGKSPNKKIKGKWDELKRLKLQEARVYEKYRNCSLDLEAYISKKGRYLAQKNEINETIKQNERVIENQEEKSNYRMKEHIKELVSLMVETIYFYDSKHIEVVFNLKNEFEKRWKF